MKNCNIPFTGILSLMVLFLLTNESIAQKKSQPFEFEFEGDKLRGLVESPADQEPTSLVIIVPGSGMTNFVVGNWYNDLRSYFVSLGMACCVWDKAGCGKSEGEFKHLQPAGT